MFNLMELKLPIDANDDILYAISQGCSEKLQILEVNGFNFTDEGWEYLEKCRNLKKIQLYLYNNDPLTLARFSSLLLNCPDLQKYIGCPNMGELFNGMIKGRNSNHSLKLTCYTV